MILDYNVRSATVLRP